MFAAQPACQSNILWHYLYSVAVLAYNRRILIYLSLSESAVTVL